MRLIFAVENISGNESPRKHTLFLNFGKGILSFDIDNSVDACHP
jgi:hypothetical protein